MTTGPETAPSLKVLRQLGSDAQSESFLAQVGGFVAPMVVRLVRPELALDGPRMERFLADARLLAAVSSPSLVQVRSAGRMNDGRVYVLTDFAEGQTLGGNSPLQLEALVELGEKLSHGLKALHDAGLVLGVLTAKQILLTADGPRLDPSVAALSRPPGATSAADVHALAALLQALAGGVGDNNPFESALLRDLDEATTAKALLGAFEAVRQRWGSETRVSSKKPPGSNAEVLPIKIDEPDLTGQRLGMYDLKQMLGEGAMGRVYLGKHHRIGREAAVKVLKAEHAREKDLVQRFIQEATAVSAIKNEHIVEVHDFGEEVTASGLPLVYCVMEVLDGRSLADEIKLGPMEVRRACRIMQQVARALGSAHALGVVHRDVKPENIFLHRRDGDSDYVKVLDFGVAKLLKPMGGMPTSSTQAGMIIGTPDYMAPEQALGISTDLRVDLYAVGLVLYELLAGQQPFRGNTFGQLVVEITTKPPPPLPVRTPGGELMPQRLTEIVARCLAKKPEDRWNDATELCAALEPFAHTGNTLSLPAVAAPRSRKVPVAITIATALVVGAGAIWVLRSPQPTAPVIVASVVIEPAVAIEPLVVIEPPVIMPPPPPEPPLPAVRPPPPTAKPLERLTGKDVAKVFTRSQTKLRSCLYNNRKLLPSKEGELMLNFTVLDSGAVSRARLTTPGFEGVVSDCVVSRLKDLRFPRNLEKEVTFELPLAYVFKD